MKKGKEYSVVTYLPDGSKKIWQRGYANKEGAYKFIIDMFLKKGITELLEDACVEESEEGIEWRDQYIGRWGGGNGEERVN